jgi:hypothetical protein
MQGKAVSTPLYASTSFTIKTPSAIRIYESFSRQVLLVLVAPPRQRRAQLPARIQLIQHQLHELQVLGLLDLGFCQDSCELFFCCCAVER